MKRRGRHHLPKVHGGEPWPGADDPNGPLFMQFRWSQYSPAGSVERLGWFAKQVNRNGTSLGWKWGFGILRVLAPIVLWIAVFVLLGYAVFNLL
jgi:hypothetical protein